MNRRRGASLIETVVLMSIASVIFSLTAVAIHRAMRAHTNANAFHECEAAAWRLASVLRRDLATASESSIDLADGASLLELRGVGFEPIAYRFGESTVERTQAQGDGRTAHESFEFGAPTRWEVAESSGLGVVVRSQRRDDPRRLPGPALNIHVVGRLRGVRPEEASP